MRGENAEVDNVDGAVGVQVAVPWSGRGLPEMGLKDRLIRAAHIAVAVEIADVTERGRGDSTPCRRGLIDLLQCPTTR